MFRGLLLLLLGVLQMTVATELEFLQDNFDDNNFDSRRRLPASAESQNCWIFIDMSTATKEGATLNLAEVQALNTGGAVIAATAATLSTTSANYQAGVCIDGVTGDSSSFCSATGQSDDWLRIDYSDAAGFMDNLSNVKIFNRLLTQQDDIIGATIHVGCQADTESPP
ncbi:hypothetical protein ScalyP_jg10454, partial [Parmales sp. scaly parma]